MTSDIEASQKLRALAEAEFEAARREIAQLPDPYPTIFLIEACRVLDLNHVIHFMSNKPELGLSEFEFMLMLRGWNPFIGLLLPRVGNLPGIPLVKSTVEFRATILSLLINLGKATLLRENSDMIRHGMATGRINGSTITLRMSARCSLDHFLDRIDSGNNDSLGAPFPGNDYFRSAIERTKIDNLDQRMSALVFPWPVGDAGEMVGYGAEPDIDAHYFSLVAKQSLESRDDAGIHPEAMFGKLSGSELTSIELLTASFRLKHIRFVDLAKKQHPEINYAMSLTIWKSKREYISSIADFTGFDHANVSQAIDMFTVKAGDEEYFKSEVTPFIPLFIQVADDHLLSPVSGAFRNPMAGMRKLYEHGNANQTAAFRQHRESWMISDLYGIFQGNRYECMPGPTKLRRRGAVITDIDAAVFDTLTGELALFQLKWQDFDSNDVAKQRSRAKNFTRQVDAWSRAVENWIAEMGSSSLLKTLRINPVAPREISAIRLFAIGRSAARFQSYGFSPEVGTLASATWRQFLRLRYKVGPSENVLNDLHTAIQKESAISLKLTPIPQQLEIAGHSVVFEDLWNLFDDFKVPS